MRLVKTNQTVEYPTADGGWVSIRQELTGPQEKKRKAIYMAASMRMSAEDIEAAERGDIVTPGVELLVADTEVKLADFDVRHYLMDWSLKDPCTRDNVERLDDDSYNELLQIIKKHREKTVPDKAAEKNSDSSSLNTSRDTTSSSQPAKSPSETSEENPSAPASSTPSSPGGMS